MRSSVSVLFCVKQKLVLRVGAAMLLESSRDDDPSSFKATFVAAVVRC